MATLQDARNNELQGSIDQIGGQTVTDARTAAFVLGSLNAEVVMDLNGKAEAMFDIRTAAGALTLVFEGSIDGTNYFGLPAFAHQQLLVAAIVQEQYVPSIVSATTQSGLYSVHVAGFRRVRVRVSAYTSGTITVAPRASQADQVRYSKPIPANLHVTVTAAVNLAATASLPAAGAGMFHYITALSCYRQSTADIAGTAALIITSTNLPGTPAWTVSNGIQAVRAEKDVDVQFPIPLKSLVANTATTIVMPIAGASVINRINVSYYVGF